jgi:hypothetical protein
MTALKCVMCSNGHCDADITVDYPDGEKYIEYTDMMQDRLSDEADL